jgi:hypothetical protein
MPLIAAARLENVEISLNAYLLTALVTGAGVAVLLPRQQFWTSPPVRWVEVTYLPLQQVRPTGRAYTAMGHERRLLVNCNCFELTMARNDNSNTATPYTLSALVDIVVELLGPRVVLPIRDYATLGTPIVGYLQWRETRAQAIAVPDGIPAEQRNVSVILAYEEEYAA